MLRTFLSRIGQVLRSARIPGARSRVEHASNLEPVHTGYVRVRQFLSGEAPDHRGRYLSFILAQGDDFWEDTHDFVQWMFPTTTRSEYAYLAPSLQDNELAQLGQDVRVREGILAGYRRALSFLGLAETPEGTVYELPRRPDYALPPAWTRRSDHNDKRITRILNCLQGAGLDNEALELLAFLRTRFADVPCKSESLLFWESAIAREIRLPC